MIKTFILALETSVFSPETIFIRSFENSKFVRRISFCKFFSLFFFYFKNFPFLVYSLVNKSLPRHCSFISIYFSYCKLSIIIPPPPMYREKAFAILCCTRLHRKFQNKKRRIEFCTSRKIISVRCLRRDWQLVES